MCEQLTTHIYTFFPVAVPVFSLLPRMQPERARVLLVNLLCGYVKPRHLHRHVVCVMTSHPLGREAVMGVVVPSSPPPIGP